MVGRIFLCNERYEYHMFLIWMKILQVIAFGGLGEDYYSSLAIEKLCFDGEKVERGPKVNHQKRSKQAESK